MAGSFQEAQQKALGPLRWIMQTLGNPWILMQMIKDAKGARANFKARLDGLEAEKNNLNDNFKSEEHSIANSLGVTGKNGDPPTKQDILDGFKNQINSATKNGNLQLAQQLNRGRDAYLKKAKIFDKDLAKINKEIKLLNTALSKRHPWVFMKILRPVRKIFPIVAGIAALMAFPFVLPLLALGLLARGILGILRKNGKIPKHINMANFMKGFNKVFGRFAVTRGIGRWLSMLLGKGMQLFGFQPNIDGQDYYQTVVDDPFVGGHDQSGPQQDRQYDQRQQQQDRQYDQQQQPQPGQQQPQQNNQPQPVRNDGNIIDGTERFRQNAAQPASRAQDGKVFDINTKKQLDMNADGTHRRMTTKQRTCEARSRSLARNSGYPKLPNKISIKTLPAMSGRRTTTGPVTSKGMSLLKGTIRGIGAAMGKIINSVKTAVTPQNNGNRQ